MRFELGSNEAESYQLQEFKWLEKENSSLLVELHGDLVHDTGMRRRLSLGFRELGISTARRRTRRRRC